MAGALVPLCTRYATQPDACVLRLPSPAPSLLPSFYVGLAGKKLVEFMLDPATKKKHGLETVKTEEQVRAAMCLNHGRHLMIRQLAPFWT
jgi:hypothetical protein